MKLKQFLLACLLSLGVVGVMQQVSSVEKVRAEDDPYYILAISKNSSCSGYDATCNVTVGTMTWNIPGNQAMGDYVKIGGKLKSATTRTISAKTPMNAIINKIEFNHGAKDTQITVNKLEVNAYSDDVLSTKVFTVDATSIYKADRITSLEIINSKNVSGLYYSISYELTSSASSKNYGLILNSISFFEQGEDIEIEGLSFAKESLEIKEGCKGEFNPIFDPEETTQKVLNWSSSDTSVATVDGDGKVTGVSVGSATITATSDANNTISASYIVNVTPLCEHAGTAEDPYSIADAIAVIDRDGTTTSGYYVKGLLSSKGEVNGSGKVNLFLKDDLEDSTSFEVYNAMNGNLSTKFTQEDVDNIEIGAKVVVYGKLTLYNNSIYETSSGTGYLVSYTNPAHVEVAAVKTNLVFDYEGEAGSRVFTNVTMQFTYKYTDSDDFDETGLILTKNPEKEGTTSALPTGDDVKIFVNESKKENFIISVDNIPDSSFDVLIYVTAYIKTKDGKYYYSENEAIYSVNTLCEKYGASENPYNLSDELIDILMEFYC